MARQGRVPPEKKELFYFNREENAFVPLVSEEGVISVTVVGGGVGGNSGMRFLSGEGEPTADIGLEGDTYLNTLNGDFYRKKPTWELEMNIKGDKGDRGATGTAGTNGTNGVSISSVTQTTTSTADGGNNVITVTLSNGTTATFTVKNGTKGSTGANGTNGTNGFGTQAQYNDIIARLNALEAETPEA